jgi:hypothetical protein
MFTSGFTAWISWIGNGYKGLLGVYSQIVGMTQTCGFTFLFLNIVTLFSFRSSVYYDPFLAAHAATADPNYRLQVSFS